MFLTTKTPFEITKTRSLIWLDSIRVAERCVKVTLERGFTEGRTVYFQTAFCEHKFNMSFYHLVTDNTSNKSASCQLSIQKFNVFPIFLDKISIRKTAKFFHKPVADETIY